MTGAASFTRMLGASASKREAERSPFLNVPIDRRYELVVIKELKRQTEREGQISALYQHVLYGASSNHLSLRNVFPAAKRLMSLGSRSFETTREDRHTVSTREEQTCTPVPDDK